MSRPYLDAAMQGLVVEHFPAGEADQTHWLCPLEDRSAHGTPREAMLARLSLHKYLLLLDYTARVFREGKANLSAAVAPIFERLGTTAEMWQQRLTHLKTKFSCRKLNGRVLAATREVRSATAQRLGVRHPVNLAGRELLPAPPKRAPDG